MKNAKLMLLQILFISGVLSALTGDKSVFLIFQPVYGHCDTEDGPVVQAAKNALERGRIELVLLWVKKDYETEIKKAFENALEVRKLNQQAKSLADRYFIETLVRIHRYGEGETYTGIKPSGTNVDAGILIADKAIEIGKVEDVVQKISSQISENIQKKFYELMERKKNKDKDVESGRQYVELYVEFIHYIERVHSLAINTDSPHSSGAVQNEAIGHHVH